LGSLTEIETGELGLNEVKGHVRIEHKTRGKKALEKVQQGMLRLHGNDPEARKTGTSSRIQKQPTKA